MSDTGVPIEHKSDEKSIEHIAIGNVFFIMKDYFYALNSYNRAITYARTKSYLSLGYASRSVVFFQLECYEECLKNIEWARENGFSRDKLAKLKGRELKCNKYIMEGKRNVVEDPWNFFKLSYQANEKIPWIVDCLEVRTTEKYGRGIYAAKDLKAGDIISIEKPVIHILSDRSYFRRCANCFKTAMLNLIPCNRTASMMFCSTDCMENFYSKSIDINMSLQFDMNILSEIAEPFGGYKELNDFIEKTDLKDLKKTIFDYDLSNPNDPVYRKNLMMCLMSLQPIDGFPWNDGSGNIFDYVSIKTAKHILSTSLSNQMTHVYFDDIFDYTDGDYVTLFSSLINHSCLNNVDFFSIDNKQVGFVIKPIKAGEQLFDAYYDKHSSDYLDDKNDMMEEYNFKCDCQECLDNSFQLFLPEYPMTSTFMSRKDFTKAKDFLSEWWYKMNISKNPLELVTREFQISDIIYTLAYYATFPC